MQELRSRVRVLIILEIRTINAHLRNARTAGVLSRRGMGVSLLEKSSQLCSGATWHAAGLVTRFGGSPKLKKIHVDSLRQLTALHEEHDVGLHLTGSIRIVEKGNSDRYKEARQHCSMAALYDDDEYPTRMISPEEIKEMHPLIDLQNVECGLYTPSDGDIDPTTLTNCVARLAKSHGAKFKLNREVVDIERTSDGDFVVRTSDGSEERGDVLINAAGLWSKQISEMIDPSLSSHHKCYIIEHQYAITEELPELKRLSEQGVRVPVLRDLAGSSYIRQERTGMLVGPYVWLSLSYFSTLTHIDNSGTNQTVPFETTMTEGVNGLPDHPPIGDMSSFLIVWIVLRKILWLRWNSFHLSERSVLRVV